MPSSVQTLPKALDLPDAAQQLRQILQPFEAENRRRFSMMATEPLDNVDTVEATEQPHQEEALNCISQMLMEDTDERLGVCQEEAALRATEKSFLDILGQAYPPATINWPLLHSSDELANPGDCGNDCYDRLYDNSFSGDCSSYNVLQPLTTPLSQYIDSRRLSGSSFPALPSRRGVEEARMLASSVYKLVIYLKDGMISISKLSSRKTEAGEKNETAVFEVTDQRGWAILEGRSSKHPAIITTCAIIRNESFDGVLLCNGTKSFDRTTRLREMMAEEARKKSDEGHAQQKLCGKKKLKKELVDIRTLLVHCAEAVADGNRLLASELLNKVRQHSSVDGDCTQRLAFYLAEGLEARLAGTESQVYRSPMASRWTSTKDWLEAYSLSLAACPFDRASYHFANQTILDVSQGQRGVHIVDFGISFGFQWPSLIQRFGQQEEGPSKLRITGIDVPQAGFCPSETIEETGKRLADYANMFKVPFQYQGIAASRWETITIEDLNTDKDEVLIINCMFQMKNLGHETEDINRARDKVLETMRRMNPKVFIFGIVNGLHSSPFFIQRFKDVMFHYSGMFDMLDANVPRDNEARKMIERGLFGQDALNSIACEGAERTERPESYKQWQARCLKAGFQHLPVDPAILKLIVQMNKLFYHEEFFVVEDRGWLLQGWKGRVVYAISKWKPNEICDDR